MKKNVLFISLCFIISVVNARNITFRVMQFNIWMEGTEVPVGFEAIVDQVIQSNADIVTFNEVRNINHIHFNDRIVKALKEKGKTYYSFYSDDSGIISKYPILSHASVYPENSDTGSIYKAVIAVGNAKISVYSSHLDYLHYACYLPRGYDGTTWKKMDKPVTNADSILKNNLGSNRVAQIKAVITDAEKEFNKGYSVIIGGDFNEPSHLDWTNATKNRYDHNGAVVQWPVSGLLKKSGYIDAYRQLFPNALTHPGFTYPADNKDADIKKLTWAPDADERERIDFIYYKPANKLTLKNVMIVGPRGCIVKSKREEEKTQDRIVVPIGVWPTDHKAILATFEIITEKK
ncbi:MAG: endonuclease/exonuclease/phosphatase family protein [Paludibacter sp.]|nr:endonuclease/exonuclease/phosphatase family protein [Paludibacter sp.]